MYEFKGQIDTLAHSAFARSSARVRITGLSETDSKKAGSTALFTWRDKYSEPVLPETIHISSAHHLYLGNEGRIKCLEGGGKARALLRALTRNGALRMIEHWAALSVLLQTPLHLDFPNGETPYSTDALALAVAAILEKRKPVASATHLTPEKEFRYRDPVDHSQSITIKPRKDKGIIIRGKFDFTQYPKLAWVGKQKDEFDSNKVERQGSHLLEFVLARAPNSYPIYVGLLQLLGRFTIESSLIGDSGDMRPDEVARHKILDFAGAANIGSAFLAAEVEIVKASHRVHVEGMREFLRKIKLKPLV